MSRHIRPLLPLLLLALLAFGLRLLPGGRTIDDAYITFRYSRNLLAGEGFVYNPGERVQGTTTPLFALLMAGLAAPLGGSDANFPAIALTFSALADAATCVLLVLLARKLGFAAAGWAAGLAWAVAPYSVTFAIGGMETSLVVLLLVGAGAAYLYMNYPLAALAAGLALLARPDTLLLVAPLALDRLLFDVRRRGVRLSAQEVVAFLLPGALWGAFAWVYFGTPIPQSVAAKSEAYLLNPAAALIRFMQHYATPFMEDAWLGPKVAIGMGLILYPSLFGIVTMRLLKDQRAAWPLLAYPWLYAAIFAIANPLIFRWYLTPPLPYYILFVLVGAQVLVGDLWRAARKGRPLPRPIVAALLLLPALLLARSWTLAPDHGPTRPAPEMAWYKLELLYTQAAARLAPRLAAEPGTLAAGDVGALGYFTGAPILDTVGLMSPQAAAYYPLSPDLIAGFAIAIPPQLILEERPRYIIALEIYVRNGLMKNEEFLAHYELVEVLPTDIYGSDGMLIFERRE
ncbi:MAG: hypothetical protein EPO32_13570 [Anaerolineae bacterium]|nr:MAG: hypothetical protein EPO32_13570 [Anaerolineae bacterium]